MTDEDVTGEPDVEGRIAATLVWSGLKLEPIELLFVLGTETLPAVEPSC